MVKLGPFQRFGVYSALILCIVQWGLSYPMLDVVLNDKHVPPTMLATLRFVMMIPLVVVFLFHNYGPRRVWNTVVKYKWVIFFFSLTNVTLANIFQNLGMMRTTPALSSIIQSIGPIFVVIMAAMFLKERINVFKIGGIALAIIGSLLLITGGSLDVEYGSLIGNLLILGSAISYAISSVITKGAIEKTEPYLFVGLGLIAGALTLLLATLFMHFAGFESLGALAKIDTEGWGLIVFLSIGPGCITLLVWYFLLEFMEVSHQTVWGYLIPIFGILFSWLMVGEVLSIGQGFFTVIIILGVIISQVTWKGRKGGKKERAEGKRRVKGDGV